ncbi:hypothetical protein AB0D66_29335 [Streptomyces sp. NPDC048270]|uniref:hypothetical protein n=1 Tax=Streptomyces sp. NPDC048270 TaxID=3154615 RepID=UPI0033D7FC50
MTTADAQNGAPDVPPLRLVHSSQSLPTSDATPRTENRAYHSRGALYAVPQYVASLFQGTPAKGVAIPDEETLLPGATGPADERLGELVSAEEMALAVQRTAVGSDLTVPVTAPAGAALSAQARAGLQWFGGAPTLHHVHMHGQARPATPGSSPAAPLLSDSAGNVASPQASTAPPYGPIGGDSAGASPHGPGEVTFSVGGGADGPGGGFAFGPGGFPPGGEASRAGIPLDRTPEWAALLDMLADRRSLHAYLDNPAFLDALAGRLHERILAHIRRELVVDRERHGLLAPRT